MLNAKNYLFSPFLIWFLILYKFQDGDHVWWRHRPPAEIHDYSTKHSFQVIEPSQTNEDTELPHHVLNTNEAAMRPPVFGRKYLKILKQKCSGATRRWHKEYKRTAMWVVSSFPPVAPHVLWMQRTIVLFFNLTSWLLRQEIHNRTARKPRHLKMTIALESRYMHR